MLPIKLFLADFRLRGSYLRILTHMSACVHTNTLSVFLSHELLARGKICYTSTMKLNAPMTMQQNSRCFSLSKQVNFSFSLIMQTNLYCHFNGYTLRYTCVTCCAINKQLDIQAKRSDPSLFTKVTEKGNIYSIHYLYK